MLSKLFFVLLGAALIIQGYDAAPYRNMKSSENALRERLKLVHIYASDLHEILIAVLGNCKELVEKLLRAPEVIEVKTELMTAKLEELQAFVKRYNEFVKSGSHDKEEAIDIATSFNDIEKKYDFKKALEKPEDIVIANFIKGAGFVRLNEPIKVRIRAFIDRFYKEVQTYIDGLNEVEKSEEAELFDFMAAMKAQPDFLKQGDLIRNLIEGFDLEKFVW